MIQQINNLINNQVEGPILKAKSQIKIEAKKDKDSKYPVNSKNEKN